eukprot:CAMPEP_0202733542 /NCGR_PEP_ID=MMETSP1385-20130828/188222_1 /ASSEMBLY_ACC=CAM_ASM_000861 /TAXON_ID=933848 /ORGANISM="Elphidium margaritaceum" /LENGTH=88 /DNA_ID=CAMNT_0049399879 /DNA_START=712 /DNA_END=978 /DNA_ORIENTATION=+
MAVVVVVAMLGTACMDDHCDHVSHHHHSTSVDVNAADVHDEVDVVRVLVVLVVNSATTNIEIWNATFAYRSIRLSPTVVAESRGDESD